jgi:hypothetical protein
LLLVAYVAFFFLLVICVAAGGELLNPVFNCRCGT